MPPEIFVNHELALQASKDNSDSTPPSRVGGYLESTLRGS